MGLNGCRDEETRGLAMSNVRFTSQAITDLEEIKRYISDDLFNAQAALDLITFILKKIRRLDLFPQTGAQLRSDIPALKIYRVIPCKNYLVFYRINEKNVSIIRVLYARRDYLGLLDLDKRVDNDD